MWKGEEGRRKKVGRGEYEGRRKKVGRGEYEGRREKVGGEQEENELGRSRR